MLRSRAPARLLLAGPLGLALAVALAPPPAAALTGVCPDGSIFVVQTPESIPCANAKQVQPEEVPPLRPEHLPRPYTWQVYKETHDPNNAYNLVDSARQVRSLRDGTLPGGETPRALQAAPAGSRAARVPTAPADLGLSEGELRDLFLIVELTQSRASANFLRETADGREVLRVSFAHSDAFQARLEEAWRSAGAPATGAILLFSALAREPVPFYANLTFSQAHLTFRPDADDPRQLGVLQGRLGPLEADEAVLGYVVLPESMQVSRPLDVYWNDRRTTVTFRP